MKDARLRFLSLAIGLIATIRQGPAEGELQTLATTIDLLQNSAS